MIAWQPFAHYKLLALLIIVFTAFLLAQPVGAQGQIYYVATNGNDANPGTLAQPFATWQKAIDLAQPGDTIYLRGGVYAVSGNRDWGVSIVGRNGTATNPIKLWAYQNETPILDAAGLTSTGELRGLYISASWWHLKGLEIRNVPMRNSTAFVYGLLCESCNNNKFERLNIHHNQGTGLAIAYNASNNLVENSDFHHNYDSNRTDGPGNHANGMFIYTPGSATSGNVVRGCRAWWNSDDGFDLWEAEGVVVFENNWAFWQGYVPDTFTPTPAGNGNGFKLGINTTGKRHLIHHNLAFENLAKGFDANDAIGIQDWYNNTAYNNRYGNFQNLRLPNGTVVNHRLRNNLAFDSATLSPKNNLDGADQQANAWNLAVTVNAADFVSLNATGVDGPRQADGSLPNLNFLRLAPGSDLIDKGVNVGGAFNGTSPDLGAFESGPLAPTATPTLTPTPSAPTPTPTGPTPAPTSPNLIRNGDFSAGSDPWWWALQGNDGLTYGAAGVTNQELCTTINRAASTFLIRLGQGAIPMQEGVTYQIEFDARANRTTTLLLQLYRYEPVGDSYSEPQFALNTATQRFSHRYLGRSGLAALEFQPQMQAGATICVDNVSWRALPLPSATPTPTPAANGINGLVTDESNGQPLAAVSVTAYRLSGTRWSKAATSKSNAHGAYQFTNLPAGDYRLLFTVSRYQSEYYDNVRKLSLARTIPLNSGQTVSGINAALSRKSLVGSAQSTPAVAGDLAIQLVAAEAVLVEADAVITLYQAPGWRPRLDPADNADATCESLASLGAGATWDQPAPTALGEWVDEGVSSDAIDWSVAPGCWYVALESEEGTPVISPLIGVNDMPVRVLVPMPAAVRLYLPWITK